MIMQYKFLSAALAGVSAFAVGLSAPSAHAQVQARAFEIAQQPLGPALRAAEQWACAVGSRGG